MEPGDGYRVQYPAFISNNFSSIQQIIARKRRRNSKMREDREISPEYNDINNHHYLCTSSYSSTRRSCSSSSSASFASSPLVVLLTSLLLFLCLVPHTCCLPFGDGHSLTLTPSSSGGHYRSQLDLLLDPVHQAEFGEDAVPLESKRIVAKSVFDMVLRTPPPPTSSSNRCPPGTQSPFEGGPCIKKNTGPVATVDESFLLESLRGLAKEGVLLPTHSTRTKRPGGGRRRPSGRPRPKTTYEPPTSPPTTPAPVTTDANSEESASTFISAGENLVLDGITQQPSTIAPVVNDNDVNRSTQPPILPSAAEYQETTQKSEAPASTSSSEDNPTPPIPAETVVSSQTETPTKQDETSGSEVIAPLEDDVKLKETTITSAIDDQSNDEQIVLGTTAPPSSSVVTTQKMPSLSTTSLPSSKQNQPAEVTTTANDNVIAITPTTILPSPEQVKSGQDYLDNLEKQQEVTTSQLISPHVSSSANGNDEVLPESVPDDKKSENVTNGAADITATSTHVPPSSSPTFTKKELTVDVIAKDGTDKDIPESSTSTPLMTPSSSIPLGQVAEGEDKAVDITSKIEKMLMTDANKDDYIIFESQKRGDIASPSGSGEGEQENLQVSPLTTRMIKVEDDKKPVLIQDLDQGEHAPVSQEIVAASKASVEEKQNQRPVYDSLILDEKVVTPSSKESAEESKREEDKRVVIPMRKEGEPKRPLKSKPEAGQVPRVDYDYEIAPERQVHEKQEATETTTAFDANMTGSNPNMEEEKVFNTMLLLPQDQNVGELKKGVDEEKYDRLPSSLDKSAVNHLEDVKGTVMPVKREDGSDLLTINNTPISPVHDAVTEAKNKDGDVTSPTFIADKETSPSSREETEQLQDFTILARDQPVLNEEDGNPLPKLPATTLLPPTTTIPASPSFSKESTLLQFQLPIVTKGPSQSSQDINNNQASGFQKFPEFPVPLPVSNDNTGKIRFPSTDELQELPPSEGGPKNRATFRPIFVQDYQIDYPLQKDLQQEWQTPKPFPLEESSSSPSPIPHDPHRIQTSQPEFYDTGSTEYLESELDRRHQKTRSRNRIKHPDAVTTNSPLPPELVFYPSHNPHLRQSHSTPTSQMNQVPLSHQLQNRHNSQPFFFARRNPSSEPLPFGYLNFRSGHGYRDMFNDYSRRLMR